MDRYNHKIAFEALDKETDIVEIVRSIRYFHSALDHLQTKR